MLKVNQTKTINCQDWDDFVQETYGKIYCFQQQDGCKDRGIEYITVPSEDDFDYDYETTEIPFEVNGKEMGVSFQTWLNTSVEDTDKHFEDDRENELFWERNFYPSIDVIADDLYSKGLLEAGKYMIIIDW